MLKQYAIIQKVDEEQRMVYGYASTGMVDKQGETVTVDAMKAAWSAYMEYANIREMHQSWAAGVVKEYQFDDVGVMIGAKIVDDAAWTKVKEGVYKGFSIGGKKLPNGFDPVTKTINALELIEISLVDRPANPGAKIEVWKSETFEDDTDMNVKPIDTLTKMIQNGEITTERLLELAKMETTPVVEPAAEVEPVVEPTAGVVEPEAQAEVAPETPKAETSDKDVSKQEGGNTNSTEVEPTSTVVKGSTKFGNELRLAIGAGGGDIAKGLSSVGWLADLMQGLVYLQDSMAYEAEYEADGSPLPGRLADCITNLGDLLLQLVVEETTELQLTMNKADTQTALQYLSTVVTKAVPVNKADHQHDHNVDVNKALGLVESLSAQVTTLTKTVEGLQLANADLEKRWKETPAVPKGVLRVVEKGQDYDPANLANQNQVQPVYKADGTVDEVTTGIKAVHASGGRPLMR